MLDMYIQDSFTSAVYTNQVKQQKGAWQAQ